MKILGVYTVNFGEVGSNVGGEMSNKRPAIVISKRSEKDDTFLVVPLTSKKPNTKYRGGFVLDNTKYINNPKYPKAFVQVRKMREVSINRVSGTCRFELDTEDTEKLIKAIKSVIIFLT